jgi:hypothetical protein
MRSLLTVIAPLALASALSLSAEAQAQIYKWVDSHGDVHYTDDPSTLPKQAKPRVTEGGDISRISSSLSDAAAVVPAGARQPGPRRDADRATPEPPAPGGREERFWRKRFLVAHERIARIQRQIEEVKRGAEVSGLPVNARYVERCTLSFTRNGEPKHCRQVLRDEDVQKRAERKVKALQEQLLDAELGLETLEREASERSVPREWRR